jgi:hypothetical protein
MFIIHEITTQNYFFLAAFLETGLGLPFTDACIMLWNRFDSSLADFFLIAFAISKIFYRQTNLVELMEALANPEPL